MKAKRLRNGDTIGIIAPAGNSTPENVKKAIELLKSMGYKVKPGKTLSERRGYLAGTDHTRASDINEMFADPDVDAIICLRGGYGCTRLLDRIDFEAIRQNPKIFMGYSDITALHTAIFQNTGLITFHGPMLTSDWIEGIEGLTEWSMEKALKYTEPIGAIQNPPELPIEALGKGKAKGRLIGGNLCVIAAAMGTPYEIDTRGRLLFIEDIDEEPYRIDRMLTQLRLAGKLDQAAGIILCDWKNCCPKEPENSLTLSQVFRDIIEPLGKPVLSGYKIGHCKPQLTIPIGAEAMIDCDEKKFTVLESGVI